MADSNKCRATTATGQPCKNRGKNEYHGFCAVHRPSDKARPTKAKAHEQTAFRAATLIVAAALVVSGIGLITSAATATGFDLVTVATTQKVYLVSGTLCTMAGLMLWKWRILPLMGDWNARFVDVDRKLRPSHLVDFGEVVLELRKIRDTGEAIDYEKLQSMIDSGASSQPFPPDQFTDPFVRYFQSITKTLESKADVADEKASILLDKGTTYARRGIYFYFCMIVIWQVFFWNDSFKQELIYGLVATSILFAFIEFLSAWFLKQYRHFVDTSTYLIKVKALFDRYMLAYLVVVGRKTENAESLKPVTDMLGADLKWPDMQMLKRGDVSFAKEAMESMSSVIQQLNGKAAAKKTKKSSDDE